jgi:hypothetical protein
MLDKYQFQWYTILYGKTNIGRYHICSFSNSSLVLEPLSVIQFSKCIKMHTIKTTLFYLANYNKYLTLNLFYFRSIFCTGCVYLYLNSCTLLSCRNTPQDYIVFTYIFRGFEINMIFNSFLNVLIIDLSITIWPYCFKVFHSFFLFMF